MASCHLATFGLSSPCVVAKKNGQPIIDHPVALVDLCRHFQLAA
jgi:hypothetical protein